MQNVCLITSALTINGRCPYLLYIGSFVTYVSMLYPPLAPLFQRGGNTLPGACPERSRRGKGRLEPALEWVYRGKDFLHDVVSIMRTLITAGSAVVHKDQEEPLGRSRRTGLGPVPAVKDSLDIHGGHLPPPHLDQGSHNIPDHIF